MNAPLKQNVKIVARPISAASSNFNDPSVIRSADCVGENFVGAMERDRIE